MHVYLASKIQQKKISGDDACADRSAGGCGRGVGSSAEELTAPQQGRRGQEILEGEMDGEREGRSGEDG
jgi:hypothetical protein